MSYNWYRIRVYKVVNNTLSGSITRNLYTNLCTCWPVGAPASVMEAKVRAYVLMQLGENFDCQMDKHAVSANISLPPNCSDFRNISKYINSKSLGRQKMKLVMRRKIHAKTINEGAIEPVFADNDLR